VERGGFELLCAVSKILLVAIDCDDAHGSNEQITFLEKNSERMTDRLQQNL
jgi:hypothetical protein